MTIRPTQAGNLSQIQTSLAQNMLKLAKAQLLISSGKRITKPSDDPGGTARLMATVRRLDSTDRYASSAESARSRVDSGASYLQQAANMLAEAKSILVQGSNGTLNDGDRALLATRVHSLKSELLAIANAKDFEGYLFSGTATNQEPFASQATGQGARVAYLGNGESAQLLVGEEQTLATTVPGDDVFAKIDRGAMTFGAYTGLASGQSGDVGSGYWRVELRHDATSGSLGSGVAFAGGGAADTILGAHTLEIDAAAGTVALDGGTPQALPQASAPDVADFTVYAPDGAELHLDFSAYNGASSTSSVSGDGSISLDGVNYTPLDFVDADLELVDSASGARLFVDTTGIHRAGTELVLFGGAVNVFDVLQGIAEDLENVDGLPQDQLQERLSTWIGELDRNSENVLSAIGLLGGRSQRLSTIQDSLADAKVGLTTRRSGLEDIDYSQVILDMTNAQQTLELAQASGVRLLNNSLLDFLR